MWVHTLDVQETFEDWKYKNHGQLDTDIDQGNDNEEISVLTESGTLTHLTLKTDLYQSDKQEELNVDTFKTIQTYCKKNLLQSKISFQYWKKI